MIIQFVYLHGFASGPQSQKATAFAKRFAELGLPLAVPDLEGGDFKHLTISRQLRILLLGPPLLSLEAVWEGI